MPADASEADGATLDDGATMHDELVLELMATLRDGPLPVDPAELEHFAALILLPLELPDLPLTAAAAGLLEAIEERHDAGAAGLLEAMALIATEPLAGMARTAVRRLADEGIVSPVAGRLGTLAVEEAARIDGGDAELLVARLRRPRARKSQVAVVGIDHEDTGGALIEVILTPPLGAAAARRFITGDAMSSAPHPARPIDRSELVRRAAAAGQRAVEAEVALDHEAAAVLPLVARALTGDPAGLGKPLVVPPWESDDPELFVDPVADEEGFERIVALLLEELEAHARATSAGEGAVGRNLAFVAASMLEWKGAYDDGRLGHWTADDLDEYLLGYFPRKLMVKKEELDDVPECVVAFLRFLDVRGSLSGDSLEELADACDGVRDEFRELAGSSELWGLGKSIAMQMFSEGVDPDLPGAVDAWMTDFNSRPRAERDAVIGEALDRLVGDAPPEPRVARPAKGRSRAKNKAGRAARKRNRRHG